MTADIIQIGNSQGIRIPSELIKQFNLTKVFLEVKKNGIFLRPINKNPRASWDTPKLREAISKEDLNLDKEFKFADSQEEWEWE